MFPSIRFIKFQNITPDGRETFSINWFSNLKTLKQKPKQKVKQIAFDLIKLYAQRKQQKVFRFRQILICRMN